MLGLVCFGLAGAAPGADWLTWRADQQLVDAHIESWKLPRLLQEIAAATGWQVFVEPNVDEAVSARFKGLPQGEALRLLLGKLNFALLPQTNGAAKFFVYRTSLHDATQLIRPPARRSTGDPIPDELVVRLKDGPEANIEDLARQLRGKVIGRLEDLDAYRLKFEDEAAAQAARARLTSDERVEATGSNYYADRPTETGPVTLRSGLPFNLRPALGTDPRRVIVGLIDTAVQLEGVPGAEFFLPPLSVADAGTLPEDFPTHGTAMSQTLLAGLARATPDGATPVRILPVDVYGNSPTTTTFDIARGIHLAIEAGATVINLSLGSEGHHELLHFVIRRAHERGVIFLGAAGNEPSGRPHFPAAYPEVIAVTAGDRRGHIAPYANHGEFVDAVGPGTSLIQFNDGTYLVTGTSAATAFVAGTAAALKA
ncbi:MAG: S8 family serine peptidase, partial [Verrucomicrobiales bacterium]|nr:S8 family serine peptidase [Verrucomicrobiales bacterium]